MAATFGAIYDATVTGEHTRILLDGLTQAPTIVNRRRKNDEPVKREFLDYIERILDEIDETWLGSVLYSHPECVS